MSAKWSRWLPIRKRAKQFRKFYFAERPVDLNSIGEFRNDAFPNSGPVCWLDQPDALIEVNRRHQNGMIDARQVEMCKKWIFDGYFIAPGLIGRDELDAAWHAYESAIADGSVMVHPEPVGPDDPYPERNLVFCGGPEDLHYWMEKTAIVEVLRSLGFDDVRLTHDQPEHPNGPAVSIFARRSARGVS